MDVVFLKMKFYETPKNEIKTALNKLNIMKEQRDNDIVNTQESKKPTKIENV